MLSDCQKQDRGARECEVKSAGPGLGGWGPGTDTATPTPHGARESLRSENLPEQPRLGCLLVSGHALQRQVETLESVGRKLQSEPGDSGFK